MVGKVWLRALASCSMNLTTVRGLGSLTALDDKGEDKLGAAAKVPQRRVGLLEVMHCRKSK